MDSAILQSSRTTVLLAEPRESTGSSSSMLWKTPETNEIHQWSEATEQPGSRPITLGLTIRRARLAIFTSSVVVIIVALTVFFHRGLALEYFDSRSKNSTQQTKLLDDYNSYSGNVASVFGKPIELFVTVAVQVIVLRFMADTFTRPEMSWRISAITLLIGAGIGYLIGNGFNALNVQLRPQEINTVISDLDLVLQSNFTDDDRTSRYLWTTSEMVEGNPISNTMLMSAIMPKEFRQSTNCALGDYVVDDNKNSSGTADEVKEPFVNLGFMQRDWQGRILQEAPPSDILRIVVNPSNKSLTEPAHVNDLPMNVTLAAELYYHAITMGTTFFPWGKRNAFANTTDIAQRIVANGTENGTFIVSTPEAYGLLPTKGSLDDTIKMTWFLRESKAALARQFAFSPRTKQSDIVMEFSHTQVAPAIQFQAVTLEFEIDPMLLATAFKDNSTRFTILDQALHCPQGVRCMIPKTPYRAAEPAYDPPTQVFALAMCTNDDSVPVLRSNFTWANNTLIQNGLVCSMEGSTNDSMLVISIGKRLVAESLKQNTTASSNGTSLDQDKATVTNLRKIFTFTVGRLSWEVADLKKKFNARCGATDDSNCFGLDLELARPLDATINTTVSQHLILGVNWVPLHLIANPDRSLGLARANLALLDEPPEPGSATPVYEALAGDVLLPHNVENITWEFDPDDINWQERCSSDVEDRLMQILNNHLYMEHGLQVAYTSAVYFLFMYGSVKDIIKVTSTKTSLDFYGNSQAIAVWVSTPTQNMWLTLAGCFVLVAGLGAALAKASWFTKQNDALANITAPHAIARVIVDERHYPPLFLHRRVVETEGVGSVDNYTIAALSLQQQQQQQQQQQEQLEEQRGRELYAHNLSCQRQHAQGSNSRMKGFHRSHTTG